MADRPDKILIVGTSYCGSTFLARVLMEAGCDFGQGDPPASWTVGDHSIEHPAIVRGSYDLYRVLWDPALLMPDHSRTDEAVRQCQPILDEALAVWPPFVKSPAMGHVLPAWFLAGLQARGIIVCWRGLEETLQSLVRRRQRYGVTRAYPWQDSIEHRQRLQIVFGMMMVNVMDSGLPWAVVSFPSSVEAASAGPIYDHLQARIGLPCSREVFLAAHQRAADPSLVNVKRGEPWVPLPKRSSL